MNGLSPGDLLEQAAELRRQGRPFVLATVVRSVRPASARPGDRAMSSDQDHPAVRAALEGGVQYVAMVASRRRTEALIEELRADGVAEDVIGRLKAPAGLDIGAATGPEIALSVLAEIVQRRRARQPAAAQVRETAIDPICGMQVDVA